MRGHPRSPAQSRFLSIQTTLGASQLSPNFHVCLCGPSSPHVSRRSLWQINQGKLLACPSTSGGSHLIPPRLAALFMVYMLLAASPEPSLTLFLPCSPSPSPPHSSCPPSSLGMHLGPLVCIRVCECLIPHWTINTREMGACSTRLIVIFPMPRDAPDTWLGLDQYLSHKWRKKNVCLANVPSKLSFSAYRFQLTCQ